MAFVNMEEQVGIEEVINTDVLKCELNTLSRADGSSILCQNDTVMAAAVYGPVEVKQHKMHIDKAHVEIVFKPKCGSSQIGDRLLESIIGKICETAILTTFYPRTAVYIIVQELQNSGSVRGSLNTLACSINAACLALIHAGIAMNFLFAAITSKVSLTGTGTLSSDEEENLPSVTFVFENTSEKVLAVDSYGKISEASYENCLKKCRYSSKVIFKFYKDMIKKYAIKM